MTQTIKNGDKVSVDYTGRLENGDVFDTSKGRKPLESEVGAGQMIEGFDNGVVGMSVGENKSITIPPEKAYGLRSEQMVIDVPKDRFPDDMTPEIGMGIQMKTQSGSTVSALIQEINDDSIVLDANHPLAGKTLIFDVEVVSINA